MNPMSIYANGFARVAAVTLPVHLANPQANATDIIESARECSQRGIALAAFPELSLTGYSADDLFLQAPLLDATEAALARVVAETADLLPIIIVGAPIRLRQRLYNCAVFIHRGQILGLTPKKHIPNYREFYEARYFSAPDDSTPRTIDVGPILGKTDEVIVPFHDLIVEASDVRGFAVTAEICEDMWVPVPPSHLSALAGATVVANLSASPVTVGRDRERELLVRAGSARTSSAYIYCASGLGESTTDLAWDGHAMIAENGDLLAHSSRFNAEREVIVADIDLDRLVANRVRQSSFGANKVQTESSQDPRRITVELGMPGGDLGLERTVERFPFFSSDPTITDTDCYEAYQIQVAALVHRLESIGNPKIILGVSGGLDSTHALLVAVKAMDRLGRPRTDVMTLTMPGFATTDYTKNNARELCEALGVSFEEIDIRSAATQMLSDIGHPAADGSDEYDITYENVQAGLRTDYLFRLANHYGGIVLGTGDLSELALGWCTYGVGDQMSHYAINTGLPKTMISHLVRWVAATEVEPEVAEVLRRIVDMKITPELIPTRAGEVPQSTEASIGPYNLQDFTLFYVLRYGYHPAKIALLATYAWADKDRGPWPVSIPEELKVSYTRTEILEWMEVFYRRFFSSQFKRSALPNGPKVMNAGSLSPRGDWRMPSDVAATVWLDEVRALIEMDRS